MLIFRREEGSRHTEYQPADARTWVIAQPELVAEIERLRAAIRRHRDCADTVSPDRTLWAAIDRDMSQEMMSDIKSTLDPFGDPWPDELLRKTRTDLDEMNRLRAAAAIADADAEFNPAETQQKVVVCAQNHHASEADCYEMLERESERNNTSANTLEYYRKRADAHKMAAAAMQIDTIKMLRAAAADMQAPWLARMADEMAQKDAEIRRLRTALEMIADGRPAMPQKPSRHDRRGLPMLSNDLGHLHYPSSKSAVEDIFWITACAAWDRLSASKNAVDRSVALAFFEKATEWAARVREDRGQQNSLDNAADELQ